MNGAGSKAKGADWERIVCKRLSMWMTHGARDDLFWRSAMSGGRASVQFKAGGANRTQVGDISAIDPIGERLTSLAVMECKYWKSLNLLSLLHLRDTLQKDSIAAAWTVHKELALKVQRAPVLFAKDRNGEFALLTAEGRHLFRLPPTSHFCPTNTYLYQFDFFLLTARRP